MSAMISSGAFPNVALRNPPIPGPVCSAACSVASPISHASGISAIAATHELDRLVEVCDVMQHDDERPEQQAGEEDAADHGRTTLATSPRPSVRAPGWHGPTGSACRRQVLRGHVRPCDDQVHA